MNDLKLTLEIWPQDGGWEYDVQTSEPPAGRATGFVGTRETAVEHAIESLRQLARVPEPADPRLAQDGDSGCGPALVRT